jgi:hypothetical protein
MAAFIQVLQSRENTFTQITPAMTDAIEDSQTAGRMSKGFCAPFDARIAETVAGIN